MWIGNDPVPFETVFDERRFRSYAEGRRLLTSFLNTDDPEAPRLTGEPFVARTFRLADRLAAGRTPGWEPP